MYSENNVRDFFKQQINISINNKKANSEKIAFNVPEIKSILNNISKKVLKENQFNYLLENENNLFDKEQRIILFNVENQEFVIRSFSFFKDNEKNILAYDIDEQLLNSVVLKVEPPITLFGDEKSNKSETVKKMLLAPPMKKRGRKPKNKNQD